MTRIRCFPETICPDKMAGLGGLQLASICLFCLRAL
jgi:hypothetical protein